MQFKAMKRAIIMGGILRNPTIYDNGQIEVCSDCFIQRLEIAKVVY